ncbi:Methionyl-tRNA formyltransferase [Coemansia sp. RSA 2336]|nr:Methionyl-tRNA formyltransferase [Coemansia sp. RSA 2336]
MAIRLIGVLPSLRTLQPLKHSGSAVCLRHCRLIGTSSTAKPMNVLLYADVLFGNNVLRELGTAMKKGDGIVNSLTILTTCNNEDRKSYAMAEWRKKKEMNPSKALKLPPFLNMASSMNIPVYYLDDDKSLDRLNRALKRDPEKFDIFVICPTRKSLVPNLLPKFSASIIKIHPSLLPKYRGPSAMQYTILNEEKVTGVSIIDYSRLSDKGKILAQYPHRLTPAATFETLSHELSYLGSKLLIKTLENLDVLMQRAILQPQQRDATYSPPYIPEEMMQIVWEKMTAEEIYRLYRAFHGYLAIWTMWRRKGKMYRLFINEMYLPDERVEPLSHNIPHIVQCEDAPPGTMFFRRKVPYLEVPCIDGKRIHITSVRIDSRTSKNAQGFANGYLRVNGALRMLTNPVDCKKPVPKFVYPPGHRNEHKQQLIIDDNTGF